MKKYKPPIKSEITIDKVIEECKKICRDNKLNYRFEIEDLGGHVRLNCELTGVFPYEQK